MKEYVICVCFAILFCTGTRIAMPTKSYDGILRILCGIFVVSTMVSPVVRMAKINIPSFETDIFKENDEEFYDLVQRAKNDFSDELVKNGDYNSRQFLAQELSGLFGCEISVKNRDGKIILEGVEPKKENEVLEYVSDTYGLEPEFD